MADPWENFPIIPHENAGEGVDGCGCLVPEIHGDEGRLVCNECGAVVRTLPRAELEAGLIPEDLLFREFTTARCPHCSAFRVFPGFSAIEGFVCSECGQGVSLEHPVQ